MIKTDSDKESRVITFFTLSVICLYAASKFFYHLKIGIFDLEEFYKTRYILEKNILSLFIPGKGNSEHFFGHPGFLNFTGFIFTLFFEKSLKTFRALSILYSSGLLIAIFFYFKDVFSPRVALFTVLSLMLTPMFVVQSIMFLNEIPAFFWAFCSLIAFRKNYLKTYFLLAFFAVFTLESMVAFYISIALLELLKYQSGKMDLRKVTYSIIPVFLVITYVITETIILAYHPGDKFVDKLFVVSYQNLGVFATLYSTLEENFSFVGSVFLIILSLGSIIYFSKKLKPEMRILLLTAVQMFGFFFIWNEYSGGRDHYLILIMMFVLAYMLLNYKKSLIFFVIIAFFQINNLYKERVSAYQSNLFEFKVSKCLKKFSRQFEDRDCWERGLGKLFCSPFYGINFEGANLVSARTSSDILFEIVDNHPSEREIKRRFQWNEIEEINGVCDKSNIVVFLRAEDGP